PRRRRRRRALRLPARGRPGLVAVLRRPHDRAGPGRPQPPGDQPRGLAIRLAPGPPLATPPGARGRKGVRRPGTASFAIRTASRRLTSWMRYCCLPAAVVATSVARP